MLRSTFHIALAAFAALACSSPPRAATELTLVSDAGLLAADVSFAGPVARGRNELRIELTPRGGDGDARLLAVDATMAAHAHVAHAEHIDDAGSTFHVQDLDLFMTGRWQIELSLSLGERADALSFPVDVP